MAGNIEMGTAELLTIRLTREYQGESWGFRLQGGVDFSTPLSIQVVQPNSVAERCGLRAGDGILKINNVAADTLLHDDAKAEIIRSGNEIILNVQRGAVKIWKPQVTPLSELRPQELRQVTTATGEQITPVQKTSLVINKPDDEPCRIGSSHNRAAQPFGAPKQANPTLTHSQYNSPMGLYTAENIAQTYSNTAKGVAEQMQNLDLDDKSVGTQMTGTYQVLGQGGQEVGSSFGGPPAGSGGFRSVKAPEYNPSAQQKQKQQLMRCGDCDMLVTGVCVRASGVPYHVQCFKCTSCGMNLKQKGFFVVENKLYCETHAKRATKPPSEDLVATAVYR